MTNRAIPMSPPFRSLLPKSLAALLLLVTTATGRKRAPAARWFEHSKDKAWLHSYDPTLISRRLTSELSYQDLDSSQSLLKLETTLRWNRALSDNLGFGLQMMVPLDWMDSGTADETGTGDIEFRTGIVGRISPALRYGFGVNATIDSASKPELGGSALVLRPTAAIRWDITEHLNWGVTVKYSFTPRDEGPDDVSELKLEFPLAVKLSDRWSAALTYKPRWNLFTDDDRHRVELAATHVWGPDHQYALSFSTELPLSDDSLRWKFLTGFAWHF